MTEDEGAQRRALRRVTDAERERVAEQVREAASDGRLGLDEIDERLGSALAARTRAELDVVLSDLGDDSTEPDTRRTDEVISAEGSPVERVGRWLVPPRLVVKARMSSVQLDFTEANFSGRTCHIDVDISASSLRLVIPADVAVDVGVTPRFSSVTIKVPDRPSEPRAVIRVEGNVNTGSVVVARPGWWRRRQLRKITRQSG